MSASNPVADSIKHSITKNGYPGKVVRLPFKPVYVSCKKNGTTLADVLEYLKTEGILSATEGDYLVFRSPEKAAEAVQAAKAGPQEESSDPSWWSKLSGMGDLSSMAKDAMDKMTPEQLAEVKERVANMSDEEKKNIVKMMSQFGNPFKGK
jgi:DNA-binding transcriptional MerR regulator